MRPAFSVIFLTTLIGAGQGLFVALTVAEWIARRGRLPAPSTGFYVGGCLLALVLLGGGLIASFFHLGRPERAWRAATRWRTSWLSREVILLPVTMAAIFGYGALHFTGSPHTAPAALLAVVLVLALFACTGMIYACLRFVQEWATPWTLVNFSLLGCASGFTQAAAWAAWQAPALLRFYVIVAIALGIAAGATRLYTLTRNARLKPASTLASAIGVSQGPIVQTSAGFLGGSFNTREFFHGQPQAVLAAVRRLFPWLAFALPLVLLGLAITGAPRLWSGIAVICQYAGLVAERWIFFAEARHPQNLYYQSTT